MPVCLLDRILSGVTPKSVEAIQTAVAVTWRSFATEGRTVGDLRSVFTPGESRCRCLFEAPNAALVQEVNDGAQLPYIRIVLALDRPRDAPAREFC